MKITKSRLKRIIKEELQRAIKEGAWEDIKGMGSAVMGKLSGKELNKELGVKLNDLRSALEAVANEPDPTMDNPRVQDLIALIPRGEGGGKGWSLSHWGADKSIPDEQMEDFNATTKEARLKLRAIADGSYGN